MHLSVITLGEIMRGIALKEKSDPQAAARLTAWLQTLRHHYTDRILPITDQIAVEWGRVAALRPRGDADGLIAATAIVHCFMLVTGNVVDVEATDAPGVNPGDLR